jgi:chorismate dehydratase
MNERIRISAISYLNTAPLMWDFEHGGAGSSFDISYTLPSQCAIALHNGTADIGIIPAAAYTTIPDLVILPGVAIASLQAVRSILLVSKVPLDEIRSVAMDTSSMTSVALTKVLFERAWKQRPDYRAMDPDLDEMLAACDAALVIGDPALQVDRSQYQTWDLAEEWINLTGKPFVFAFWAIRSPCAEQASRIDLAGIFQKSRDHGLNPANVDVIARDWAPRLSLSEANIREYLARNIHYYLDEECLAGMALFYQYAHECGALPQSPELHFLPSVMRAQM